MEKIIYGQLFTYISNHNFISPAQYAFLNNHSTITSHLHTTSNWNNAIDKGHVSLVCFFDISKCFDCINHSLLLDKLTAYGILNTENRWFRSYLTGRTEPLDLIILSLNLKPYQLGFPRGPSLDPCYSYSLSMTFVKVPCIHKYHYLPMTHACIIHVLLLKALFLKSKLMSTESLSVTLIITLLLIVCDKSFAIVVGSRQKLTSLPFPYPPVTFGETVLKYETVAQYLGVTIDSCLTWKEHINSLTSKI